MNNNVTLKAGGNTDIAENGEIFYTVDGGTQTPFNCGKDCVISLEKGNYKIKMFFKRLGARCGIAAVDIAVNGDERLVLTYIIPELISQDGKIEVDRIKPKPKPEPKPEPEQKSAPKPERKSEPSVKTKSKADTGTKTQQIQRSKPNPVSHPEQQPVYVPIKHNLPSALPKNRVTAGVLGILLGSFGAHKLYLGKTGIGILYLLFCWTYIPCIVGFIEGISYLCQSDENFWSKYC